MKTVMKNSFLWICFALASLLLTNTVGTTLINFFIDSKNLGAKSVFRILLMFLAFLILFVPYKVRNTDEKRDYINSITGLSVEQINFKIHAARSKSLKRDIFSFLISFAVMLVPSTGVAIAFGGFIGILIAITYVLIPVIFLSLIDWLIITSNYKKWACDRLHM